jgi:preprotein translocase subunit YajC
MKKKLKIIIPAFIIAGAALALYGIKEYNRTNKDTLDLKTEYSITATELYKEFETDEQTANVKLNDKVISVNGIVSKIENTDSTKKVLLSVEGAIGGIICEFDKTHVQDVTGMREGNSVQIKGICNGMLMDVLLVRCAADKSQQH